MKNLDVKVISVDLKEFIDVVSKKAVKKAVCSKLNRRVNYLGKNIPDASTIGYKIFETNSSFHVK